MRYKFFYVRVLAADVEEEALNLFCAQHHILQVDRQFVADGANSFWAICVSWSENNASLAATQINITRKNKIDYKDVLSAAEFAIYLRLRDLRKQVSEREGVAIYNIFTNEQMAEMVQARVCSKASMGQINGIGTAKLEKYADEFLACLLEQFEALPVSI